MKNQVQQKQVSVIGVDVAKEKIDCHHLPSNEAKQFANSINGFKEFITWAKKLNPEIVLCENTGGYEKDFVLAVADAEIPVCAKNPKHIRMFARSFGTNAKTDKNDAKVIALFAAERKPKADKVPEKQEQELKELLTARRQLVRSRVSFQNQQQTVRQKDVLNALQKVVEEINEQIAIIENTLEALLSSNDDWQERHIYDGRTLVRCVMYNAAKSAVYVVKQANVFQAMYERLTAAGKSSKTALIAVAHKMLKIVHALLKNKVRWENKLVPAAV
jgi:transposase